MKEFDWDVLQKKRVASGAYHIKRGSRSKKCTLPSDYMTASQKRRMNGNVETYNMTAPMAWKTFKKLPNDLKEEYMQSLVDKMDVSQTVAARDMFSISSATMSLYLKENGLVWPKTKHGLKKFAGESLDSWNEFLNRKDVQEPVAQEPAQEQETKPARKEPTAKPACNLNKGAELMSGSLTLCGNVYDIASKLVSLLGANGEWRIKVEFDKE